MTRVPTYMSNQLLVARMQDVQQRLHQSSVQVSTEQRSQDYIGLSSNTFRLLNLEATRASAGRYQAINAAAEVRVETMGVAVEEIDGQIADYASELKDFSQFRSGTPISREYESRMRAIQQQAAQALSNLQYSLNIDLDGRFLFSGGATDGAPVDLPTDSDAVFRAAYDGNDVIFPETRGANLFNADFRDLDVAFANTAIGAATYGEVRIDVGAGETSRFITGEIAAAGDLTYSPTVPDPDPALAEGSITSNVAGAFSGLTEGMTLLLDSASGGPPGGNDGVYTVTEVSADGRVIKTTPPVPNTATDAAGSYSLKIGAPDTATLGVENSTGNDALYTVRWPSNDDLQAAGVLNDALNGEVIFTTPQIANPGAQGAVNVLSKGYYQGDTLETIHRVDQNRTIRIGVNAADGAFEKAIRALGVMSQDLPLDGAGAIDLPEYYRRLDKAIALLEDSRDHRTGFREDPSDLQAVSQRLALNQVELNAAQTRARDQIAFLEDGVADIENVDMAEAITRMNDDSRTLQASFQVLSQVSNLSLLQYI